MQVEELLAQARETFGARREYGEPYEKDGVTIIPASSVRGGGGGGKDHDGDAGGGFGLMARPTGAWVIREGEVVWKPAVDPMRMVLGAELLGALALLRTSRRHRRRAGMHARQRQLRRVARRPKRACLHLPLH